MCAPDPNAGARLAAKQTHMNKVSKYESESLKYWNKETTFKRDKASSAIGFSRAQSDAYQKASATLSQARQYDAASEIGYQQKLMKSKIHDGSQRSRTAGRSNLLELLRQKGELENSIDKAFNRNMDTFHQRNLRQYQSSLAKNRERLGTIPEFGAPVIMPPKDRTGQFLQTLQTGLSIGSSLTGLGAFTQHGLLGTNMLTGNLPYQN